MRRSFRKLSRRYRNRELPIIVWVFILFFGSFLSGLIAFNFFALPFWVGVHEEITIPDVCGKPIEQAKKELNKTGLKFEIKTQQFSNLPKDIVISQFPPPARKVTREKVVQLCISRGKEKIKVPWIAGLLLYQAKDMLQSSGLEVGEIIYEYSAEIAPERVIGSEPKVDAGVYRGSKVNILVSQGEPEIILPSFIGTTLKQAQEELGKSGIRPEIEYVAKPSPMGLVLTQKPSSGTRLKRGDTVKLLIGSPRKY